MRAQRPPDVERACGRGQAGRPRLFPAVSEWMEAHMRGLLGALLVLLAAPPVAAASLEERLAPCLACHGEQGQSANPEVPSLGGQPAFYVMVQLYMFRERLRIVEPMNEMTKGLS